MLAAFSGRRGRSHGVRLEPRRISYCLYLHTKKLLVKKTYANTIADVKSSPTGSASGEARTSFSFYPADLKNLNAALTQLGQRKVNADRTKFVRCLLHTSSELDLFALAAVQHRDDSLKAGPRESDYIQERFTIVLPEGVLTKLDRVVAQLAAKNISANESYILRAALRRLPPLETLAPLVERYLEEFPDARTRAGRAKQ